MELKVDSATAYIDGEAVEIGKVIEKDGVSYVSVKLFENIFGWNLENAEYDLIENDYYFSFSTYEY